MRKFCVILTFILFIDLLEWRTGSCRELQDEGSGVELQSVITSKYFSNQELEDYMRDYSTNRCSQISRMFSIGKSVEGQELWVLEISNRPGIDEPEPNFKYVANMHGDEPGGRQLLMMLAEWLCMHYQTELIAKRIVDDMHLFLMPTMNPDGYDHHSRGNRHGTDLNRNFPDRSEGDHHLTATGHEEPETLAVMQWIQQQHFVASGDLHEGALVANYPWDGKPDHAWGYAASPDDLTFIYLSKLYAGVHRTMHLSTEFKYGITNGNAWYPVFGGMQDYNYIIGQCMEITLELSMDKNPPEASLYQLWLDNFQALLALPVVSAFGGLSGRVKSCNADGMPLHASISVAGIDHIIQTNKKFGDFYRPLAPGSYNVTVGAAGHVSETVQVVIPKQFDVGVVHDFYLQPNNTACQSEPEAAGVVVASSPPSGRSPVVYAVLFSVVAALGVSIIRASRQRGGRSQ